MIRLTHHQTSSAELEVKVEGRLDAQSLRAFRGVFRLTPDQTVIDLSGVTSVDPEGRGFLAGLVAVGCRLRGGSLYINLILQEVTA